MTQPVYRIPPYRFEGAPLANFAIRDKIDWGLLTQGIPDHWKETQGKGILVGIIDTGEARHVDLPEAAFSVNMSTSRARKDKQGHATHVAGTVGARANDKGVVGVAPKCDLGYVKGLGDDGSGYANALAGAVDRCVKEGCHIINCSWGGGFSRVIDDAVKRAESEGVLVIVAAGNDGYNGANTVNHPASSPSTIAIASYNRQGRISEWSSGGKEVDVAFPGEAILSTWLDNQYNTISGTSMATPFAVGVAALAMAAYRDREDWEPSIRVSKVREIIKATAQDKGPSGKDDRWGWGVVEVGKVVGWEENSGVEEAIVGPYRVAYKDGKLTVEQRA